MESLQKKLSYVGFSQTREPYDVSSLSKPEAIIECETIASKGFFNILYLEVKSNWKSIAQEVAQKNENPCLVITSYVDYTILATMRDHNTLHAKPRYVVIDNSKPQLLSDFIKSIKVELNDNIAEINDRVQNAFDKFSEYTQAIDEFAENLEDIIKNTKSMIEDAISGNKQYEIESKKFLKICRDIINDNMEINDIKEMLIQHILTYQIFSLIYDENNFHNINTVAKSLESLKSLLQIPSNFVDYKTMELIAESITDTNQRQEFLRKIYETFYKKYDPAKADKDGIVYTPSEVVDFMIRSTEQLLKKHFKKSFSDDNVAILDPSVGTGTFPVHILKYIDKDKLESKYKNEIYANEISILPYYIATLNIEHTYQEIKGNYQEFENICWMDTLDSGTKDFSKLTSYFGENGNVKRIVNQQKSKISVIIGNPPYNAVQTSVNDANAAEKYPEIDKKISDDYSTRGTGQGKLKAHDMYKRFLKWSSERIDGNGMIVFVSNNSFLDAKADDGVRRALYDEFDYIYTVNLKGKSRDVTGEELKKEGENVFDIRVGVCVSFFIKTGERNSDIQKAEIENYLNKERKLKWLTDNSLLTLELEQIIPDENAVWLNQTNNDFESLLPVLSKETNEAIFKISTPGVVTAKDPWVYDFNKFNLKKKMECYISSYNDILKKYKIKKPSTENLSKWVDKKIKWSYTILKHLERERSIEYSNDHIKSTLYRPFVIKHQYFDKDIIDRQGKFEDLFKKSQKNRFLVFSNPATNVLFNIFGTDMIVDFNALDSSQCIPLWKYDGGENSNITQYGLELFQKHYKNKKITDDDIFYYVYAMFNDPKYEEKYRYDLRRSLPRIPLAKNFQEWTKIGKSLFEIHCNFNDQKEYGLKRIDKNVKKNKIKLSFKEEIQKNEKSKIRIVLDDITTLEDIPTEVLDYTFESKNPLWWILACYKENKNYLKKDYSNDESILKKFNTYKFEDHKEEVIVLLNKVTTVCVETVKLRNELRKMEWGEQPKLKFTKITKKDEKSQKNKNIQNKKDTIKKKDKQSQKSEKLDNFA
jgi:predicted helicase